ncbi:MAG: hypothetical protein ABSE46_24785 [Terracidiphilus sp.]|jgi:hypothetical protein
MDDLDELQDAKLEALRGLIAEGIASGSEDSEVVFAELDEYMNQLVAQRPPAV